MINIFKNKKVKTGLFIALGVIAAWFVYANYQRNKQRTSWINWITAQVDLKKAGKEHDGWADSLVETASTKGITVEAHIADTANYLFPRSIFKPKP